MMKDGEISNMSYIITGGAGMEEGCERSVKIKSLETTKINQN